MDRNKYVNLLGRERARVLAVPNEMARRATQLADQLRSATDQPAIQRVIEAVPGAAAILERKARVLQDEGKPYRYKGASVISVARADGSCALGVPRQARGICAPGPGLMSDTTEARRDAAFLNDVLDLIRSDRSVVVIGIEATAKDEARAVQLSDDLFHLAKPGCRFPGMRNLVRELAERELIVPNRPPHEFSQGIHARRWRLRFGLCASLAHGTSPDALREGLDALVRQRAEEQGLPSSAFRVSVFATRRSAERAAQVLFGQYRPMWLTRATLVEWAAWMVMRYQNRANVGGRIARKRWQVEAVYNVQQELDRIDNDRARRRTAATLAASAGRAVADPRLVRVGADDGVPGEAWERRVVRARLRQVIETCQAVAAVAESPPEAA